MVNFETEKSRIDVSDYSNKKLKLISVNMFDCNNINPFKVLPENVSDVEYRIDLLGCDRINNEDVKNLLEI